MPKEQQDIQTIGDTKLSRAQFLNKINLAIMTGALAAAVPASYRLIQYCRSDPPFEPLSAADAELWKQKVADLDADPDVQQLRQAASHIKEIKRQKIPIDTKTGPFLYDGHLEKQQIALTFDDGPLPTISQLILRTLISNGLGCHFFQIGARVVQLPAVTSSLARHGQMVGSHTMHHPKLAELMIADPDVAFKEIMSGHQAVEEATGGLQAPFFRFPYGDQSPTLLEFIRQNNFATFDWNMDGKDWKFEELHNNDLRLLLKAIIAEIDRAGKGILLMHERLCTALVLPDVLNYIKLKDFTVVQFVPM